MPAFCYCCTLLAAMCAFAVTPAATSASNITTALISLFVFIFDCLSTFSLNLYLLLHIPVAIVSLVLFLPLSVSTLHQLRPFFEPPKACPTSSPRAPFVPVYAPQPLYATAPSMHHALPFQQAPSTPVPPPAPIWTSVGSRDTPTSPPSYDDLMGKRS